MENQTTQKILDNINLLLQGQKTIDERLTIITDIQSQVMNLKSGLDTVNVKLNKHKRWTFIAMAGLFLFEIAGILVFSILR